MVHNTIVFVLLLFLSHINGIKIIGNKTLPKETLGTYGSELKINCDVGEMISYCVVKHPNHTEFTPRTISANSSYWYTKTGYGVGECILTIKAAVYEDSGVWQCFMGKPKSGPEIISTVKVRIGSSLAAVYPIETVTLGESVTLYCVTAGGNYALNYCRFTSPEGVRFNIDNWATENSTVLDEYYFPKDASLFRGDCAVTIINVKNHHLGKWMCAATIDKHNEESSDFIILQPKEGNISAASASGIAIGLFVMVGLVGASGYFVWKKKLGNRETTQHRNLPTSPGSPAEASVQYIAESDTSATQLTISPEIHTKHYGASTSTST